MRLGIYKRLLLSFFVISSPVYGKDLRIVIAYPVSETAQAPTYAHVIEGIEKELGPIEKLEVPERAGAVQAQLDRLHPDKIIALGKRVAEIVNKTSYLKQSLVGLVHFNASEYNGVSLVLDSRSLIAQLSRFVPSIKRVFVVQQAGYQTIDSVPAPSESNPALVIREGSDQLATIRILGHLVEEEATNTDAVFIPANLPLDILYEVAKVAWDKKVMLLSTNLAHLDTGTLMGFYPNEVAIGTQLGQLVRQQNPGYESLKGINSALNRKVAQHLAVDFNSTMLDLFTVKIK
jgi:hypothetical protein